MDGVDAGSARNRVACADLGFGVTVKPGTRMATKGAQTDALTRIEDVTGIALADGIHGSAANNVSRAPAGDDTPDGGAGFRMIRFTHTSSR